MTCASGSRKECATWLSAVVLLAACSAGCGDPDGYSPELRYPVRTDPIIVKPPTTETAVPDRPGVLPIMNMLALNAPNHPLHSMLKDGPPLDPSVLAPNDRAVLQTTMDELFGTPLVPRTAGPDAEFNLRLREELDQTDAKLATGSLLYRQHCLHCHGLAGDGRGPTAFWINPHPRDYRPGLYKFISISDPQGREMRASKEDLARTVRRGLDGTAMPAFSTLSDEELSAITAYVIHLSIRGEVELNSMKNFLTFPAGQRTWDNDKEMIQSWLPTSGDNWFSSQQGAVVTPKPYPKAYESEEGFAQSVKDGWDIFKTPGDKQGGDCLKCHTDYGRKAQFRYDAWGTMVRPADLTLGVYRGGRRPIDLYWRIHNGIAGSGMVRSPHFQPTTKDEIASGKDRLWSLVNFLQVLPYPAMREKYGIKID
ncbi:MAG: cytochrome c [Planctomycetia bacterium]|nr:cytochrome c [Planctomycetia bacterium]